ncbi:hypothetical protein FHT87_000110 [Rhizobium sp. BK316]|nr:hypothetical protein [Rhizobium sp. BK316]
MKNCHDKGRRILSKQTKDGIGERVTALYPGEAVYPVAFV